MDEKLQEQIEASQEANEVAIEEAEQEVTNAVKDAEQTIGEVVTPSAAHTEVNTTIDEVNKSRQHSVEPPPPKQQQIKDLPMMDFSFDGEEFSFEKHPGVLMDIAPLVKMAYDARQGCGISEAILTGIKVKIKLKDGRYYWPKK